MGEYTQIFIRFKDVDGKKNIVARNYEHIRGEKLINCIEKIVKNLQGLHSISACSMLDEIIAQMPTDGDDILQSYSESNWRKLCCLNEYMFDCMMGDNGKVFVDIDHANNVKYAFLNCSNSEAFTSEEYMQWNRSASWRTPALFLNAEEIAACITNIENINQLAMYMTEIEIEDFLNYEYQL